jgi:hypothetical protein
MGWRTRGGHREPGTGRRGESAGEAARRERGRGGAARARLEVGLVGGFGFFAEGVGVYELLGFGVEAFDVLFQL